MVEQVGEVASDHSSMILTIMKIVVGSIWIGIVTFSFVKEDCIPREIEN